ncbi:hypothetical protein TNCV_738151 [Trichonephila clavipes]|nr:hypothetical protein TNCV_738151 [Trichonephila clavipes]
MNIQKLPPTLEEVELVFKTLKLTKIAGPDRIPAKILKFEGSLTMKCTNDIILAIWDEKGYSQNSTHNILCPIHKKGPSLSTIVIIEGRRRHIWAVNPSLNYGTMPMGLTTNTSTDLKYISPSTQWVFSGLRMRTRDTLATSS